MTKCHIRTFRYSDDSERTFHTCEGADFGKLTEQFGKDLVSQPPNTWWDAENNCAIARRRTQKFVLVGPVSVPLLEPGTGIVQNFEERLGRWELTAYQGIVLREVKDSSHVLP